MTTSESKGRFFLQNEYIRIDSHNESNRIDSNRELECSSSYSNVVVVAAAAADATDVKLCLHCRLLRNFYSSASDREKKLHSSRLLRLTCSCSN